MARKNALVLGILLVFATMLSMLEPVKAQPSPIINQTPVYGSFTQVARSPDITATASSSATALGASAPVAIVYNTGSVFAYVKPFVGTTTVTVATGIPVPPGGCSAINIAQQTFLAAITATGSTTLQVALGSGNPGACSSGGGGNGGGGGGAAQLVGLTPTDHTITSASGASQQIMAANTSRHSMTIVNTGSGNCGVNPTGGTALIGGAGTLTLTANGGAYTPRVPTLSAVTVICTSGQPIYADDN